MFSKRFLPKYKRRVSQSDIERIEQELRITLPPGYRRVLRDNPLAFSRSSTEPAELCMDAGRIIETNLSFRQEGYADDEWPRTLLWIGDAEYPTRAVIRLDADDQKVYLLDSENDEGLDNLASRTAFDSVDKFLLAVLRGHAQSHTTIWETILNGILNCRVRLHRRRQARLKRAVDASLARAHATNTRRWTRIDGTFRFVTRVPLSVLGTLVIENRWTFSADGCAVHEPSAISRGITHDARRFGHYQMEENVIVVDLPCSNPREFRFTIVDENTLIGYQNSSFGIRERRSTR